MVTHLVESGYNPVEVSNVHLSLLVGHCVPTKVIRVHNRGKPWFDDQCRNDFDFKQEARLRWASDRYRIICDEIFRAAK